MFASLLTAFGLMLLIEGLLPLLAPGAWRDTFRRILELRDGQIRFIGFGSALVGGVILLYSSQFA
jgi:uncharacterized protein